MATILEYATMSNAVYDGEPSVPGWSRCAFQPSGLGLTQAFQGAAFKKGDEIVVAFKGTSQKRDFVADFKLGVGMNTSQYGSAGDFVKGSKFPHGAKVSLTGHSLGGAMAQTIGNRHKLPFVTFNAPGVGLMSKNVREMAVTAVTSTAVIRIAGTLASSLIHPVQAFQDLKSVTYFVRGVNFRVGKDVVGSLGVHFGKVIELPYSGGALDVGAKHKMATVLEALAAAGYNDVLLDTLID